MLKNLKAKLQDNKGFSLVELIVVIAIMVILIAMLVPNVVGYIKKATWATEQNAASAIYSAAQTCVTDKYAIGDTSWKSVDLVALKEAELISEDDLTKCNNMSLEIVIDQARPAVVEVEWVSDNAPEGATPVYPVKSAS